MLLVAIKNQKVAIQNQPKKIDARIYRVHKVIPVGLYGLGAYVCRAHFLYRARSAVPRTDS